MCRGSKIWGDLGEAHPFVDYPCGLLVDYPLCDTPRRTATSRDRRLPNSGGRHLPRTLAVMLLNS